MVVMRRASEADFTFVMSEYDEEIRLTRINGVEALSELFLYKLRFAVMDSELDFDTIVGSSAYININGETGERYVNGIISRLVQVGVGNEYTSYNAELVPKVWLLNLTQNSRIFQEMTIEDIITQIFEDNSIPSDMYRFSLNSDHPEHEYCVQYRESDFNFISRLMEEEGIFYLFEHDDEKHVMIITDNASEFTQNDSSTIRYAERSGMGQDQENIYSFRFFQQVRPGVVSLGDFNFEQPSLGSMGVMSFGASEGVDSELEVYDYPGDYSEQEIGNNLADWRIEALRASGKVGVGQSICRRLFPGYRITLDNHPRSSFNIEYLITRLTTMATQPLGENQDEGSTYNNDFECIPYEIPFRPSRKTIRPIVEGVQTAMVVGPSDEEIYTDEYGRIKVQFHWDKEGQRDENSSCWIRVSQGWAGANWGMVYLPRIGQEVIVDFLEGDPDRPIITGRVYNGESMPPYNLPDEKTKSTVKSDSSKGGGGSNEIRFEDSKGNEEIYVHAQKDMNEKIENNMSTSVGANQSISVGGNRSVSVSKNETFTITGDETIEITGNRNKTVKTNEEIKVDGTYTETIKGATKITITTGAYEHKVAASTAKYEVQGNLTETYNATQDTTVKGNITIKSTTGQITVEAASQIELKTGASSILLKKDGTIEIKGMKVGVEGTASVGVKGKASVDIAGGIVTSKADTVNTVKGNIVLSEGKASNTVKGGMVMLNP